MNMPMLTPSVKPVPASDNQRMISSLPRGTKINNSANTLGMKTTADIQSRSRSAMSESRLEKHFGTSPKRKRGRPSLTLRAGNSPRCRHAHEIGQYHENPGGGQHQEQNVTPQETRLHVPQTRTGAIDHIAYQVDQTIDDVVVEQAVPLRQQHSCVGDCVNDAVDDMEIEPRQPVAHHQGRTHSDNAVRPIETPFVDQKRV